MFIFGTVNKKDGQICILILKTTLLVLIKTITIFQNFNVLKIINSKKKIISRSAKKVMKTKNGLQNRKKFLANISKDVHK